MSRDGAESTFDGLGKPLQAAADDHAGPSARSSRRMDPGRAFGVGGSSNAGIKTRAHILAVSEALFAKDGYERVSVRTIAAAADVNIASINYHFGSKQRLFEALFEARAREINEERLVRLDAAIRANHDTPRMVREVVDAFIRPALALIDPEARSGRGKVVLQFLNRAFGMPDEEVFVERYYGEVRTRFVSALCELIPSVPAQEMVFHYNLMVGALIFAMAGPERMFRMPEGVHGQAPEPNDTEMFIRRFVDFCTAGFLSARGSESPI